ncbi:reverse transcriptase N-terminal domain-containing protein [Streptomyces flavofungini]|uniref:reverse transcriptase N-terminal domain-containing protein n=1 Tax=Streptomyces flavofungini TaxID=68200 RepID=UPI0019A8B4B7|nr:reverse transcriptase N-terminal domain-containing protein [Streptomyces flavofungini]GHC88127.1 hypothetical protein GCM10010349_75160 [Streptomyces flavofungini]
MDNGTGTGGGQAGRHDDADEWGGADRHRPLSLGERTRGQRHRPGRAGRGSTGDRPGTAYAVLRQAICTEPQAGDLEKARNPQKLMLRSRANALMSVRRVTELNAGRATAGIASHRGHTSPKHNEAA